MTELTATVVVPTTRGRGPLLPFSVGSALHQTVEDIEVVIVGDGVDDDTRSVAHELVRTDDRVRFVDHPKHASRGEEHRHEFLSGQARGRIVTYLCDRDLYLPAHVATLAALLEDADLAYTMRFGIEDDGSMTTHFVNDLAREDRHRHARFFRLLPLSFVGHSLDAYRRLPYGWRTAPRRKETDRHMWDQFLDQPWCRVAATGRPTVLYFKRGDHPGLAVDRRRALLEEWTERMAAPGSEIQLAARVIEAIDMDRVRGRSAKGAAEHVLRDPAIKVRSAVGRRLPASIRRFRGRR